MKKMYFVVNAFFPNKKAYGIHIAKMCEAFIEQGIELTLVIPHTARAGVTARAAFGLRVDVPTVTLPALSLYDRGRALFFLSSVSFMCTSLLYLWLKRLTAPGMIYTVDLSTFSFAHLPLAGMPIVIEVHEAKPTNFLARFFFRRVHGIVATNPEIRQQLEETFADVSGKILIEPNGVDAAWFTAPDRAAARARLKLPAEARIALYLGRFYEWKGLDVLVDAASAASEISWYVVGGSTAEFSRASGRAAFPENLSIAGESAFTDVPTWLAAADTLLVLGTQRFEQSYRHTTPMKVYEYMAARRPIVAAKTPALTSFVEAGGVGWYTPDDAADLVRAVRETYPQDRIDHAARLAATHTWAARAERIRAAYTF